MTQDKAAAQGRLLPAEMIELDYARIVETIKSWIADYVGKAGKKGAIVGLSGGLDSAVVAALCARALGKDSVTCVLMPTHVTSKEDISDAREVAKLLGIRTFDVPIDPIVSSFESAIALAGTGRERGPLERGNISARARMTILHDIAARTDSLVVGTGDKSEICIGYFTKYGDGGTDLLPIGDLYKTQVRRLAKELALPPRVYTKPSSPNLWPNQTAEEEFGMSYELVDTFLWAFFEKQLSEARITEAYGIPADSARKIVRMVATSQHKKNPPVTVKISSRSFGSDWRYPTQMGYEGGI